MTMSIEVLDIAIIAIGAIIGVTALALLKKVEPTEKKQYKKYSSFLLMGGSWSIVGFLLGTLYRGSGVFDNTLLTLGIIFLCAGGIGVINEYFRRDKKNYAT
jgi:predicted membrane channel-forming protein YqfA (hemolysin III family)